MHVDQDKKFHSCGPASHFLMQGISRCFHPPASVAIPSFSISGISCKLQPYITGIAMCRHDLKDAFKLKCYSTMLQHAPFLMLMSCVWAATSEQASLCKLGACVQRKSRLCGVWEVVLLMGLHGLSTAGAAACRASEVMDLLARAIVVK